MSRNNVYDGHMHGHIQVRNSYDDHLSTHGVLPLVPSLKGSIWAARHPVETLIKFRYVPVVCCWLPGPGIYSFAA